MVRPTRLGSVTALPSAPEQHGPFPLFKLSNHCFSGELA
jgi:hypothetical protein